VDSSEIFVLAGLVIGLLFGSFLNVCISRLPWHESIVTPRSRCPECGTGIRWYDNVPLLSWVLLRARCRDCKAAISWQYPAVELAVGLWGWFIGSQLWNAWFVRGFITVPRATGFALIASSHVLGIAILGFLLIGLMVMDWQTMRLPDAFTLWGIFIAMVLVCVQAAFIGPNEDQVVLDTTHQLRMTGPGSFMAHGNVFMTGPEALIFGRLAEVCGAALILLLVRWGYKALRRRDGLGLGDVKLLAMIAAFLGLGQAVLALFIGVLAAALYGVFLLARRQADGTTKLAFGSFLCAGGLICALFGNRLIGMYMALLR
jgi:leader peptidase (prepilin peptidase) / N-methyltransferase